MKDRTVKLRTAAALLVGLCLIFFPSCKKRKAEEGAGTGGARPSQAVEAQPEAEEEALYLSASVFVNDSRALSLTPDIPVWVRAVFDNPLMDRPLTLKGVKALKPVIRDESERQATAEWEMLPTPGGTMGPESSFGATWIAQTSLPPGSYTVGLERVEALADLGSFGISGLRVEPALLTIQEGTASAAQKAFYDRQLLLVRGRSDELLGRLGAELEKNPEDQNLRLEYVDALALAGKRDEAAAEMLRLIVAVQESQSRAAPGKPPHIPSWMFEHLAAIRRR